CIPVDYIRGVFEKLNCKSKLSFIDTCFSGAMNSKSYGPSYKAIKVIKTVSGEISGEGSVVFTASKEDEKSIEDLKLENGVFTSFLLEELQGKRDGEKLSITDVVTPITEKVIAYTNKEHHFKQTPTFTGNLKGLLYLPVFKNPLCIKPDVLNMPKSQQVVEEVPVSPKIDTTSIAEEDLVEKITTFVLRTAKNDPQLKLEFQKFSLEIGKKLLKKWENMSENPPSVVDGVPEVVAQLEAESYHLFILCAAVGAYGNAEQSKLIAEICGDLLKATKDKSGLIAFINIPEVIVAFVEYLLTMTAIITGDFSRLKDYMDSKVYGFRYDREPPNMISLYHTHYADALTGHADKVADYIRKSLNGMGWLKKIHPRLNVENMDDLQIQANFIIVILRKKTGYHSWPDFGRFYSSRVYPIIEKIKYDESFEKSFADLLAIEPKDLKPELNKIIDKLYSDGLGSGYWWNSISGEDFLTTKELQAIKERENK
ncbi:MAG: caspase family protein, partial [Candidatus Pacearchaeota archaeon]